MSFPVQKRFFSSCILLVLFVGCGPEYSFVPVDLDRESPRISAMSHKIQGCSEQLVHDYNQLLPTGRRMTSPELQQLEARMVAFGSRYAGQKCVLKMVESQTGVERFFMLDVDPYVVAQKAQIAEARQLAAATSAQK